MNILILNPILFTHHNNIIPVVNSIKDCMIYDVAMGFKNLGHHVTLIASEDYKPQENENYEFEVIFIKSEFKKIFLPSVLPFQLGLIRYLIKNSAVFDLIISSELFSFPSFFSSLICPKKTLVWHELAKHNKKFNSFPSLIWYNVIVRFFFKNILVVPRSAEAKFFIQKYKRSKNSSPVDHGVNINKFHFSFIKKNQFIVLSRLVEKKNIGIIITKFYSFVKKYGADDFKMLIIGDGPEKKNLHNQIKKLDLESQIILSGFKKHDQLNTILSESLALLIHTSQDNNMISVLESIASGTAVLMNEVPTNSSLIRNNNLGIVKKDWNEDDLKLMVMDNPEYSKNCIAFHKSVSREFCAKSLLNIFLNENSPCK